MPGFEHLLRFFSVADQVDEIASAEPPAYLRRCFAEGSSAPRLSLGRLQQLAVCAIVLDALIHGRAYDGLETEMIDDWRAHYPGAFGPLRDAAVQALQRGLGPESPLAEPEAVAELKELLQRLSAD